jgi:DNA-directed RNA polymerase omega subunit
MDKKTLLMDNIDDITMNHYEAVLVAAKRARQINLKRLAQMELLTEDSEFNIDYRKVTSVALDHLLNKKVKYKYKN